MYGGVSPDDLPRPHLFASKNIREPKDRRLKSLFPPMASPGTLQLRDQWLYAGLLLSQPR